VPETLHGVLAILLTVTLKEALLPEPRDSIIITLPIQGRSQPKTNGGARALGGEAQG